MKVFKVCLLSIGLCAIMWALGLNTNVAAYESSDIERIYITSDTTLSSLQKEYVPATVEVVEKDGTVVKADDAATIKLRGNSTAKAAKKPFNIKFAKKYALFGMDEGKKWNILANAFDKSLIRNKLGLDLGTTMGLSYTSQSTFCDVYYNGQLLGNYLATEPVDAGTGKVEIDDSETSKDFMLEIERERYESDVTYINTKNGVRFAINVPEEPTAEQKTHITTVSNEVEEALKSKRMSVYSKYIDVDSFVNYYIVSELFKPVDFNYSSTRFYYKDGIMYAGPIWDYDLTSGNAAKSFYTGYYDGNDSYKDLFCTQMKWIGYLMQSDEFVAKVNARFATMKNTITNLYANNSLGNSHINTLTTKYADSFARNYSEAGWSLTQRYSVVDNPKGLEYHDPAPTYEGNVALLSTWLKNRMAYLEKEWKDIHNNAVDMLTASKETATSVMLDWFTMGIADGIEIYAKVGNQKSKLYKTINDGTVTYYEAKVKPGVKYTFMVRAFLKSGTQKTYTPFATVSIKLTLGKPAFKIKRKGKKVTLKWKKVKGAEGYVVYGGKKKSKLKKLKVLKGNGKVKFTKKQKKKYYYKVKAYVKVGKKYYYSKGKVKRK